MANDTVTIRLTRAQTKILMQVFAARLDAIHKPVPIDAGQVRVMQDCLRQAKEQVPQGLAAVL